MGLNPIKKLPRKLPRKFGKSRVPPWVHSLSTHSLQNEDRYPRPPVCRRRVTLFKWKITWIPMEKCKVQWKKSFEEIFPSGKAWRYSSVGCCYWAMKIWCHPRFLSWQKRFPVGHISHNSSHAHYPERFQVINGRPLNGYMTRCGEIVALAVEDTTV